MKNLFLKAKRTLSLVGISTSALTLALIFGSVNPSYAAHKVPGSCSLATVNGMYVFNGDGFQILGSKRRVPLAYAGIERFDGHGHTQGVVSTSTNGKIASNIPFTGTYTVSPDCAMIVKDTATGVGTLHFDFNKFTTPDANQITFLQTDPGVVASGELRRAEHEAPGRCTLASLSGRYPFTFDGFQIRGNRQVSVAHAGVVQSNGHGHLQGVVSTSANGKIASNIPFTGTYAVSPNCVVTETDNVAGTKVRFDDFTTPDGSQVTFLQTNPGVVASGAATRGTN